MLVARNIHKAYGSLRVLQGISLEIADQEVVSIVGASGAGKSTLLHILGTLDSPDQGEVSIKSQLATSLPQKKLAAFRNTNIGFIFQFHNLLPEFTALENVSIPGFIGNRKEAEVVERGKELLTMLGLQARMDHKPSELSGGEQQRVSVARALINSPSIVFADEPTGNLDSKTSYSIMDLFQQLHDKGNTIIMVTHEEDIAEYSHRIIRLRDGLIETDIRNENVRRSETVS